MTSSVRIITHFNFEALTFTRIDDAGADLWASYQELRLLFSTVAMLSKALDLLVLLSPIADPEALRRARRTTGSP